MFVTGSQFYVFVACLAFGGACGILLSVSAIVKLKIKNIFIRIIPDVVAFLVITLLYIGYAFIMRFPNFRAYMVVGVILGLVIYFKSFHILLAKCVKKLYNKCVMFFNKQRKNKKKLVRDSKDG